MLKTKAGAVIGTDPHGAAQFWRLAKVMAETGLSRSAIYEEMAKGRFPNNFPVTKRSVAWLSADVEAWKRDRLKAAGKLQEAA